MQQTPDHSAPALDMRWTFSNALSALRMVLVIPMVLTLYGGMRWVTAGICVLAAITDVLDGYIARRNNEISDLGKILDPLADKVFVGVAVILLLVQGVLPLWFVAAVLGRDLVILVGGLLIERRTGVVLPSNYPGKIAVLVLSATLLAIILGAPHPVIEVMMGISLVLLAISLFLYTKRGVEAARGKSEVRSRESGVDDQEPGVENQAPGVEENGSSAPSQSSIVNRQP